MNRKMLSGFWDAAPIFNQVGGGQALGLNRTFSSIFLESQACSAPWNVLFVLCWVCACGSRKDHSADADSSVSAFSLEVQLLSGAYILKITLLGTVSLPKQWTEKEQHVWARLDNAWGAAARNNFPATLRASWVVVHGTMSMGDPPAIFVWLWQECKWKLSLRLPPWLLSLIPPCTAKDLVPINMDTWPPSLRPIHILHQKLPLRPRGA